MATNNSKKFGHWEAQQFARKLAEKAFEHLIDPIKAQIAEIAESAMRVSFVGQHLNELFKANIIDVWEDTRYAHIYPATYEVPEDGYLPVEGKFGFKTNNGEYTRIYDDRVFETLLPLVQQLSGLEKKENALYVTIKQQIEGRTVGTVRKAWPEAGPIFVDIFGEDGPAITAPLDELLARFLPMLPAPQSEGV